MFLSPAGRPVFGGTYFRRRRATACRVSRSSASASPRSGARNAPSDRNPERRSAKPALAHACRIPADSALRFREPESDPRMLDDPARATSMRISAVSAARPNSRIPSTRSSACAEAAGAMARAHSATHVRGRHLRPARRRLLPLQRRCRIWTIPHFEKMLYDNGPLLGLLADAWLQTRDPLYAALRSGNAGWIMRRGADRPRAATTHRSTPTASTRRQVYVWDRDEVRSLPERGGIRASFHRTSG